MAYHYGSTTLPLTQSVSYPSISKETLPPRHKIILPETFPSYIDKALPPLPLSIPNKHWGHVWSTLRKTEQLAGHTPNTTKEQPKTRKRRVSRFKDIKRKSQPLSRAMPFIHQAGNSASDTLPYGHPRERNQSTFSVSSSSFYSEESTLPDIFHPRSPVRAWLQFNKSSLSRSNQNMYLEQSQYSASATELRCSNHTNDSILPIRHRHHDGRPTSAPGFNDDLASTRKAPTLADIFMEETLRTESRRSERDTLQPKRIKAVPKTNKIATLRPSRAELPSWSDYDEIVRDLTPEPPASILGDNEEATRCMSHFSDQSSELDLGTDSNVRDSVISYIRNIPLPFKSLSRPSSDFRPKAAISFVDVHRVESVSREREFFAAKHPLKSPYPFGPSHKKSGRNKNPDSETLSLERRLSDKFSYFSGIKAPPLGESNILSNYAREGNGPDTPMPKKSTFMGMMSPTTVFNKGSLQLKDAIRKAKLATKIQSREERRRDKLKKAIKIVNVAPQPGLGPPNLWL